MNLIKELYTLNKQHKDLHVKVQTEGHMDGSRQITFAQDTGSTKMP